MRSCGRRERRDGGGRGGGRAEKRREKGRERRAEVGGEKRRGKSWRKSSRGGGEVKSGGGFSVPAALRCAGRLRARGSPSPRGLFVLFWVFGFFSAAEFWSWMYLLCFVCFAWFPFSLFFFPLSPLHPPFYLLHMFFGTRSLISVSNCSRINASPQGLTISKPKYHYFQTPSELS